jgi:hypothetical protein
MAVRLSALSACRPLPPGRFPVLISVRGWVDPRAILQLEGLGKLKKSNDIGTRTRDLPACSIVPQPTTLPRVWKIKCPCILHVCGCLRTLLHLICMNRRPQTFVMKYKCTTGPFIFRYFDAELQKRMHVPTEFWSETLSVYVTIILIPILKKCETECCLSVAGYEPVTCTSLRGHWSYFIRNVCVMRVNKREAASTTN